MAKVKTKQLTIDWYETKPGYLTGQVADYGPSLSKIVEELVNIPIDVPSLKAKVVTKEVCLKYPENISNDRKQEIYEKAKELYPSWKFEVKNEDSLFMYPPEASSEQVA